MHFLLAESVCRQDFFYLHTTMKKFFTAMLLLIAGLGTASAQSADGVLAFPGADGFGKYTTGGRGGEVYYVTTTEDCTDSNLKEGTLRWALNHDNGGKPRIILFNVSGTIYLNSVLRFKYPNVSILGQTAPGGGVCLAGHYMYINNRNIIIRYIRFRAGDVPSRSMTGLDMENCRDVILDHCSMTWSMEECLTAYDSKNTTIQWCIIGEGLYSSKNAKGERAYAMQWGGEYSTMHHCLITNCASRAPRFNGAREGGVNGSGAHDQHVISEFANNVIFNWAKANSAYGGECNYAGNSKVNPSYNRVYMINNLYRPGPTTKNNVKTRYFVQGDSTNLHGFGEWYLKGNKFDISTTAKYSYVSSDSRWSKTAIERVNADNFWGVEKIDGSRAFNFRDLSAQRLKCCLSSRMLRDFPADGLGMNDRYEDYETADEAFSNVIANAGANLPRLDACDRRLLAEAAGEVPVTRPNPTKSSYVGIIDSPDNLGYADSIYHDTYVAAGKTYSNYPFLGLYPGETNDLTDSDGDGMPDQYESASGLNPNDSSDGAKVTDNGYTNVEIFLNAVVAGTVSRNGTPTGIVHPDAGRMPDNAAAYNIAGQRVGKDARGLVIKNGRKHLRW